MRKNKKLQSGFAVVAALGLGVALAVAAISIVMIKRSIELETKHTAIRYSRELALDIIKTQVAIKQREVTSRNDFLAFVKSFVEDPSSGRVGFRVPIPVKCGAADNDYCHLKILAMYDGNIPVQNNPPALSLSHLEGATAPSSVRFSLGLPPSDLEKLKVKISPMDITVQLPNQAYFNAPEKRIKTDLVCPLKRPIFRGTKVGSRAGELVADCVAVPNSENLPVTAITHNVACNISHGEWMSSIDAKLLPRCSLFPDSIRAPANAVSLCSGDSVVRYFEITSASTGSDQQAFSVKSAECVSKGSPYDFMEQLKNWGKN
jgi:hypothetical protein